MNARERARLAAEQAAARKRDRRILIMMIAAFVVILVAGGIAFQAWRTNRAPSAAPSVSVSASPVTITNGRPIPLGSAEAPVTITLYEDFHCPHCADFEEQFGSTITQAQEAGAARVELYPMAFIDLATKVGGTPSEAFKTCVTRRAHADWVTSINAVADTNGVAQTPTILINGKEVDIATLTPESLKTMITDAAQK